jgi:Asp-tRNA(Asn)/Glu-tRNA(Gln) amidotransferase A subunit family amidase
VERALERAAFLDEHLKKTGTVVGPLHGLPISVKDQFRMKGLETIMGLSNIFCKDIIAVLIGLVFIRLRVEYRRLLRL